MMHKKMSTKEVLMLTASLRPEEHVYRVERTNNETACQSPPVGRVIIHKPGTVLPMRCQPHVRSSFYVHLFDQSDTARPRTKEKRTLLFWFLGASSDSHQSEVARGFMHDLLQPEHFPKDYTSFLKKAVLIVRSTPSIKCVDILLKSVATSQHYNDEIDEDDVRWARCIEERQEKEEAWRMRQRERYYLVKQAELEDQLAAGNAIENFITVLTPACFGYMFLPEVSVSTKYHVSLLIRAKSDAHIALSSIYSDTTAKTYEIVIGADDNQTCFIRAGMDKHRSIEVTTPHILDQDEKREFWLSWDGGVVQAGHGKTHGKHIIMSYTIPRDQLHSVNYISVSTASASTGEWHFVELIAEKSEVRRTHSGRRKQIQEALLWYAKRHIMLNFLADCYPRALTIFDMMRNAKISPPATMSVISQLKDLQHKGVVIELPGNMWMFSPTIPGDSHHAVHNVDEGLDLAPEAAPSVGVITCNIHVKQSMDAMMQESKISYLRHDDEGGISAVYTVGKMAALTVVCTKLPASSRELNMAAVRTFLDTFHTVDEILLVGVGGSVPHYTDYTKHLALGDVAVAIPKDASSPWFYQCDKITTNADETFSFDTYCHMSNVDSLHQLITHMKNKHDILTLGKNIEHASAKLAKYGVCSYAKPDSSTDKLYAILDGEGDKPVLIEHPKPQTFRDVNHSKAGVPKVRYGAVAAAKFIAHDMTLRRQFADDTSCIAYTSELAPVVDALVQSGRSCAVVLGMADYLTGTRNKAWEPYAALSAAAYVKSLLMTMPVCH